MPYKDKERANAHARAMYYKKKQRENWAKQGQLERDLNKKAEREVGEIRADTSIINIGHLTHSSGTRFEDLVNGVLRGTKTLVYSR